MITSHERVCRCLEFRNPDRPPRDLWSLPWVFQFALEERDALLRRFPGDFADTYALAESIAVFRLSSMAEGSRCRGHPFRRGSYTDSWGNGWSAGEDGVVGEVVAPALADWAALATFQPPWEIIRRGDWDAAQRACEENRKGPKKFMRCPTSIRPFEQVQFLRGSENTYLDLGEESPELFRLLALVHEFFLEELGHWTKLDCDAISFMDDWGSQRGLLISPAQWRRVFKPLYRDYFEMVHSAGKQEFFHSDGHIMDIYADLIEVEDRPLPARKGLLRDQVICMTQQAVESDHPPMMRRIEFFDDEQQRTLVFLTNNMKLAAATVAEIYKNRWQIELFFKALKQSCKVKTFVGTSANALKTQIWTALIAMLLVKILHMKSTFGWHLSNFMVLLRQQLFVYRNLWTWIDDPFQAPETPPSPQLHLAFA